MTNDEKRDAIDAMLSGLREQLLAADTWGVDVRRGIRRTLNNPPFSMEIAFAPTDGYTYVIQVNGGARTIDETCNSYAPRDRHSQMRMLSLPDATLPMCPDDVVSTIPTRAQNESREHDDERSNGC